ncbi:MAG: phage integrase SAM-like domain-containing protein [Chryseolinea sp.]
MKTRLYIRSKEVDETEADIYFRIGQNNKISTGLTCPTKAWQPKEQIVSNKYKGSELTNKLLRKHRFMLEEIMKVNQPYKPETVRRQFKVYLENPDKYDPEGAKKIGTTDFATALLPILNSYRNEWSGGYIRRCETLSNKLIAVDPKFTTNDISLSWWQDYVDYCFTEFENCHNTIQSDFKLLKRLCRLMRDEGVVIDKSFFSSRMKYIEPMIEPLDWDEVKLIADLDMSDDYRKQFKDTRDAWVLGAYLGQRLSDMLRITPASFENRRIEVKPGVFEKRWFYRGIMQKTKTRISFRLLPEAVNWLEKLNWTFPKGLYQQKIGSDLKEIGKIAGFNDLVRVEQVIKNEVVDTFVPRWKRLHYHTARHTYAMYWVRKLAGKPYAEKMLSELLGHVSHSTTWKYTNLMSSQKDLMFSQVMEVA